MIELARDAVERDELCISQRQNLWLCVHARVNWTAVSRYTGQILAWLIGTREWHHLARLWEQIPKSWRRRLVYTDGYGAYAAFFSAWQHRVCAKGDGGTATVEGVNQSLRHRCGALVRRTSAQCRDRELLDRRLVCTVLAHNRGGQRRLNRRIKIALAKRMEST